MAKRQKFKGFTNEQRMKLLKSMGYDGPMQSDDIEKFIASNPKYTKKMAEYVTKAVKMVNGGVVKAALGVDVQKKKDYTKAVRIEDVQNQYDLSRPAIFDNDTEEIRPGMTQMPTGPGMDGDGEPLLPTGTNNSGIRHFGPESNASVGFGGQLDRSVGQPNVSSPTEEPVLSESKVFLDNAQTSYSDSLKAQQDARDALAADPTNADLKTALDASNSAVGAAQESVAQAQKQYQSTDIDSTSEMLGEINKDPTSKVTKQDVATTSDAQADAGTVADDAGEAGEAEQAVATDAVSEPDAIAPEGDPASTYDATTTEEAVKEVTDNTNAAEGTVSDDAQVKAVTKDPKEMSQLELEAAQIDKAQTVAETEDRKVEDGEMIEGSTVDMDRVKKDINFEAATGSPSTDATVQGQLTGLMEDFEGKDPPPWAAGAMRAAAGAMAARGLSSSSMAGQAMIQAAMESAIPIAQQDATTFAKFEAQNLSNKQQSAMFAAEKRAEFLGLEFNQDFQTRVANSAKISDIANVNFTADQQVALENARMAQSVDIANLGAKNAKVLSDAAAMSQMDLTNLNNRQKAAVQNAKSFLEMDMKNLDNEQATNIFKAQQLVSSLFNDQSAENAQLNLMPLLKIKQINSFLS